jgi:hypothetical protein
MIQRLEILRSTFGYPNLPGAQEYLCSRGYRTIPSSSALSVFAIDLINLGRIGYALLAEFFFVRLCPR